MYYLTHVKYTRTLKQSKHKLEKKKKAETLQAATYIFLDDYSSIFSN